MTQQERSIIDLAMTLSPKAQQTLFDRLRPLVEDPDWKPSTELQATLDARIDDAAQSPDDEIDAGEQMAQLRKQFSRR